MNIKLLVIFLAILAGVMCGLTFRKKVFLRERYFVEFVKMIERLNSDIKFSQQKVLYILNEFSSPSQMLCKNIDEYLVFLNGGQLQLSRGILSKREYALINEFFLRLGSLDLKTQLDELGNQKQVFDEFKNDAKHKNSSYGKAFVKLGFLAGLLIGVLLL